MSVRLHACSAHRGRKMASDPPGLELQSVVSCYMGAVNQTQVLRAVRDLNHCALSPALWHYFRAPSTEVTADWGIVSELKAHQKKSLWHSVLQKRCA